MKLFLESRGLEKEHVVSSLGVMDRSHEKRDVQGLTYPRWRSRAEYIGRSYLQLEQH